jgi:hypothetical protein
MTLTDYNTNYATYESRLIKLTDVYFPDATGSSTFTASSNNNLSDGTTIITFRTFAAGESDIVGALIPASSVHRRLTCIAGFYTSTSTTVQVYGRTLSDFDFLSASEKTTIAEPVIYPVPAREVLTVRNINNISHAEILDATGKVIRSTNISSDNDVNIPVSNLKKGLYFLRLTTPTGKVTSKFIK